MSRGINKWFWSPQLAVMLLAALLCINPIWRPSQSLSQSWQKVHGFITPASRQRQTVAIIIHPKPLPPPINCAKVACLALTFDDGPNPIATPIVLNALEKAHAHATFFVIGNLAIKMPHLLQRMHNDGDEIGNHSWSHPDLTTLTAAQVRQQVARTQAAVVAAGVPAPTLFRPPYGYINAIMRQQIHLPFIMWDDDPQDWANRDPAQIIPIVEAEAKAGGIVELHDIYTSTGQALPQILSYMQKHYTLVTVSQLLNLQPSSRGQYYNGPAHPAVAH